MKICLYTHTALPLLGGQELVVDALARHYQLAGHEVVVMAPRSSRGGPVDDAGLPYPVVRHPRFISKRRLVWSYCWWVRRLYARWPFDVMHCHGVYPTGYVAALCKYHSGAPLVLTSHGEDSPATSHRMELPELKRRHIETLQRADALIAISRATRAGYCDLWSESSEKTFDIANGVDMASLASVAARPPELQPSVVPEQGYALYLGRLVRLKGVDVLLKALAKMPAGGGMSLVIAGGGSERANLEALAAELGIMHRVSFLGPVHGETKRYLLQRARFVVVPSRNWEGMPLVLLEAFAAGRPVLASNLAGINDLVQHGKTGLLVQPDCADALAAALVEACESPEAMEALGQQAHRVARQHTWPLVAQQHLDLYARLMQGRSRSAA